MTRHHATMERLRVAETTWTRPRRSPNVRRRHHPTTMLAGQETLPTTVTRACPTGDPTCPCRDGDACNHEDDGLGQLARWVMDGWS